MGSDRDIRGSGPANGSTASGLRRLTAGSPPRSAPFGGGPRKSADRRTGQPRRCRRLAAARPHHRSKCPPPHSLDARGVSRIVAEPPVHAPERREQVVTPQVRAAPAVWTPSSPSTAAGTSASVGSPERPTQQAPRSPPGNVLRARPDVAVRQRPERMFHWPPLRSRPAG